MLSASLQFHQVTMSDVDIKTLKFLIAILHKLRDCMDKLSVRHCEKLLSETLMIISNVKSLYESDMMEEVILELQYLFVSGPGASNAQLSVCKPYLALFIGGLGGMEMAERDDCAKSCGVWELYHMLFREKHWALVHLAIAAFGYFAARTSCNQLWRFVPPNAALSYDIMSGKETNEERFMSELKAFLEKEKALTAIAPGHDQIESLVKEGILLKEIAQKTRIVRGEAMRCESMEIEVDNLSNKRRKLPDGISRGIELVQSGLKVIGEGLSEWQLNHLESSELHDNLLSQLSHLEKFANHLRDLAGS
ncbi:hypothetical protein K2173_003680 [Erythroxylum novogranatense]|uniref:Uncharacterized protein n=1 Tax=Erythroxylum novogranatense TaxID=1862640 RepID=A0AAV8TCH7_9ROSI|nr:hypothetical protein K2173_003680 [Erythroxylum novogranatense]